MYTLCLGMFKFGMSRSVSLSTLCWSLVLALGLLVVLPQYPEAGAERQENSLHCEAWSAV